MTTLTTTNQVLSALSSTTPAPPTPTADAQSRFLTLLTTQLQNQDPLNPTENAELTSQLAQLNMVDGIERMNESLSALLQSNQTNRLFQAATLIDRGVLVPGRALELTESGAVGGFTLDQPADQVVITIKDAAGQVVQTLDLGDVPAGAHSFLWDGTTPGGTAAATGGYTLSVTAVAGEQAVTATPLQAGVVSQVVQGPVGTDLQVGTLGIFRLEDIKMIL